MTSPLRVDVEFARMIRLTDGLLGSSGLPTGFAGVPASVQLDGEELCWSWISPDDDEGSRPRAVDSRGMLDAFLKIEDASGVLRFARRFGVLGICEQHGLPASHNPPPFNAGAVSGQVTWCYPVGYSDMFCREPLSRWLRYARLARALVSVAARVHLGQPGKKEDWEAIFSEQPAEKAKRLATLLSENLELNRTYLAFLIDEWIALGNLRPSLSWNLDDVEPRLEIVGGTFGLLGVQLLTAVTRRHELTICSGCGSAYLRMGRKAAAGRRNYCPECGGRAAARDAQRDFRSRRSARKIGR